MHGRTGHSHSKAQSAMEYLMTYGWAILIIAVVLGALFQLGVFNTSNFAPRVQPGACYVARPYGVGSTQFMTLQGQCNEGLPEYVAEFNGAAYILASDAPQIDITNNLTVSIWVYQALSKGGGQFMLTHNATSSGAYRVGFNGGAETEDFYLQYASGAGVDYLYTPSVSPLQKWVMFTMTYNYPSNSISIYYNGVQSPLQVGVSPASVLKSSGQLLIGGVFTSGVYMFNGSLSNVQIYNATLTANEISSLYSEGIGGAPVRLLNLAAWYPLNGNANDYSGNNNNGAATSVTYTSAWTSQYTGPV